MWKRLLIQWNQYRYRFVPWIALNLKDRSIRSVPKGTADKILPDDEVHQALVNLFSNFHKDNSPLHGSDQTISMVLGQQLRQQHGDITTSRTNLELMVDALGFSVVRAPSTILTGGEGVIVNKGRIAKGTVVAIYPGAVYTEFEPVLLQSVRNPFMFRCIDRLLIDGNNKGISRFVYRSCCQRDRAGPFFTCDMSWLTDYPANPLAIGQYVNNHNKEFPANVAYQEVDIPSTFPFELRQYLPNTYYSTFLSNQTDESRSIRTVVLISTKDIEEGEELFSSYFTVVH